eukprot:387776_1
MAQAVQLYHPGYCKEHKQYKTETHKICSLCGELQGYYDKYYEKDWVVLTPLSNGDSFNCAACGRGDRTVLYYHQYRCNKIFHLRCLQKSVQIESGVSYIYSCCGNNQYHAGCQQRAIINNAVNIQQHKKKEVGKECVICFDNAKTHALVPCGHKCVCQECAEKLQQNLNSNHNQTKSNNQQNEDQNESKCPICRCNIKSILRV